MVTFLDLGAGYTPILPIMVWAIWKQWCTFMYGEDYDPNSDWITSVLKHFKKELIMRLYESMSVIQWLKVADKNRKVDGERTVPEKEFLLIWANTVNTNSWKSSGPFVGPNVRPLGIHVPETETTAIFSPEPSSFSH